MKFIKLSRCSSSLVSNVMDEMSRYVMGVSEELEEEFRAAMLHHSMDLSVLMVHAKQVKESHLRKRSREVKEERLLKLVLLKVCLIYKTSLSSRRGFQTKFLLISPRI